MSHIFLHKPNFINLHDINVQSLNYWENDRQLYNLTMCFRAFAPQGNRDINKQQPSDVLKSSDEACSQFLKCLTKKVAEIALKYNLANAHECEIDIKKDLWMSTEAQNILTQSKYLNIQQPNIKKPVMERLANAVKFIFSTAGCKSELIELEDTYKFRLSWANGNIFKPKYEIASPSKNQFARLIDMRKNNEFVDCIIEVEGQSILAHRCILAARSPVLKAMLIHTSKESSEQKIRFPTEKLNTINLFLDYLYQGFVIIDDMNLDEILALTRFAHQYQIDDLFYSCRKILLEQVITPENIIDVYLFAEGIDSKLLMTECEVYSINNRKILDRAMDVSAIVELDQLTKIYQIAKKLKLTGLMGSIEEELLKRNSLALFDFKFTLPPDFLL